MDEHLKQVNADSISDWSKWVIGLSLFSASGCVSVLLSAGVKSANILNIKLAILFFLLTILIAWIVQFFVAIIKSYSVNRIEIVNETLIVPYKTARKWLKPLVIFEIITFTLSLFFLTLWVMKLPAKENMQPATQTNHSLNKKQEEYNVSVITPLQQII